MRRSKPRNRVHLKAKPCLILGTILVATAGLGFSPLTGLREIRIEGADAEDMPRLTQILQQLRGIPCFRVNTDGVESDVLQLPWIRNATLQRNVFGYGLLRIAYRTPVANISNVPGFALSSEGVMFPCRHLGGFLPAIQFANGAPKPSLTLAADWEPRGVAEVAIQARLLEPAQAESILVTQRGTVCLNIGTGHVVLGSCERLDAKFSALRDQLSKNRSLLAEVQELNLTVPEKIAYRPRLSEVGP